MLVVRAINLIHNEWNSEIAFCNVDIVSASSRSWSPHEASPFVSYPQSGAALWTLQENDGVCVVQSPGKTLTK